MLNTRHSKKGRTTSTAQHVIRQLTPWHPIKMSCHVFTSSKCTRFKVAVSNTRHLKKKANNFHYTTCNVATHTLPSHKNELSCNAVKKAFRYRKPAWQTQTDSWIWHGNRHSVLTKLGCHMESIIIAKLTRLFRKLVTIGDDSGMATDIVCSQN